MSIQTLLADLPQLKVTRRMHPQWQDPRSTRPVQVGPVQIGGSHPVIIAGPCAVESRQQTLELARIVADAGAQLLRGGAYKPRTSPYSFQGLGLEGLEILAEARELTGLPVVTEVLDPRLVEQVADHVDVLQIGSRNMQNFPLLKEVGRAGKPVLLKRGFAATLEEWIFAAEYIADSGNMDIIMCERGIRTFTNDTYDRGTLDLAVVDAVRQITPFPVIVDPTHAAGRAELVPRLALAAMCHGAHGLLVEVIAEGTDRSKVLCDGAQGLRPAALRKLVAQAGSAALLSV